MKKWFFTWLLLIALPVLASHIVGGEFELLHLTGNTYRLNMILYFDKINGEPGALDHVAHVYIFQKSNNALMDSADLPLISQDLVKYTNPDCANGNIVTAKLFYSDTITLSSRKYTDPQGYYVSWQRCCRNYFINNVVSHNTTLPDYDGQYAGQTFYLEFPPVVKDGKPFYNSSPRLFAPLSDYASPNRPYYVDFTGIDDDNDSLVYSMSNPLSTTSDQAIPTRSSAPYPSVTWVAGYDSLHVTKGHPDMQITTDGLLTVTPPDVQGLFVFAVRVEQFRDGVKIGENRRDFQINVVDVALSVPPKIVGKKLADPTFTNASTMSVIFDNTEPDGSRCILVRVSDDDSNRAPDFTERVNVRIVPLSFNRKTDISDISISPFPVPLPLPATLTHGSTQDFKICFPPCPFGNGPYQIGVIAFDDACALPLTDTLTVNVNIEPPHNTVPHYTFLSPQPPTLDEGDSLSLYVEATDDELDSMVIFALGTGFNLPNAGMVFTVLESEKGFIKAKLHWDAYCDQFDFTHMTDFPLRILVDDQDACDADSPVPTPYDLKVQLPSLHPPNIFTTPPFGAGVAMKINESLSFDVTATQDQGNVIFIKGNGNGFTIPSTGATFNDATGIAIATSHFQWDIRCDEINLTKRNKYEFRFVVEDPNKCRLIVNDTVIVNVKILPPDNQQPLITVQSQTATPLENGQLSITRGQPIALGVFGNDADTFPDKDKLTLKLISAKGNEDPAGYTFSDTTGIGSVQSPFLWNPDCSIFKDGVYVNDYEFKFSLKDDRCYNNKGDTVSILIKIKDIESGAENFFPTNVITPNGDGCNDYFALEGIDPILPNDSGCDGVDDPDKLISFPKDNCQGNFEMIRIVNRWGKQVFDSSDRKFRWYAKEESAGVYYYCIKFGNREYKGAISVRF